MELNVNNFRYCNISALIFRTFSSMEIRQLNVKTIVTSLSFDAAGHPLRGGLYDPALGPCTRDDICTTCNNTARKCVGHMGMIDLPLPVVNPMYHKIVSSILQLSCLNCYRILIPVEVKSIICGQLKLLDAGFITQSMELGELFNESKIGWNMGTDISTNIIIKVKNFVDEVYEKENVLSKNIVEAKGDADYRNLFLKNAVRSKWKGKKCPFCFNSQKTLTRIQHRLLITQPKMRIATKFKKNQRDDKNNEVGGKTVLTPNESLKIIREIWKNDGDFLVGVIPIIKTSTEEFPTDLIFMTVVPVTPINCRPLNHVGGKSMEHVQNIIYKAILDDCMLIRSIMHLMKNASDQNVDIERKEVISKLKGNSFAEKLHFAWEALQFNVDKLLDSESAKKIKTIGIKQIIERKTGIIRMNMMGKRVNYAARSVITPDPNLNIDEIGVPEEFAKKLTYPVPVTVWNVHELRKRVINGPDIHPGANFIENEDGSIIKILPGPQNKIQRVGLAKRLLTSMEKYGLKILHRHLVNGDYLLLNRQPTLHKPSIMAHKARVLSDNKTLRLHYANCKAYNADFDGDEMNAHFPQNEVARSEAANLVSVVHQYLVPKDGTPLSGLIQDHMVSGVRLTTRDKFFSKNEYMQLVFQGLSFKQGDIKLLSPCMIKPKLLWTGKQIISTLILNIIPHDKAPLNLISKAKINSKAWQKRAFIVNDSSILMSEEEVIVRNGQLLSGVLDKMHYGSTEFSLVHCMFELYGGNVSGRFLSSLAKLFTAFIQYEGFTLGVEDILVTDKADAERSQFIDDCRKIGPTAAVNALDSKKNINDIKKALEIAYKYYPDFRNIIDRQYKSFLDEFTNKINQACIPNGLLLTFPKNNLQLMVQSGAKGSTVNTMQISCLLGQIELEGKRPPLMVSGRSLPSFPPYDTSPRAGGFIDGRFMTGIQPQEFFFHCMAGREGLLDTAVKTSRSGYLQRCLVKHLEGLKINYDLTVRDSDGSIVQFCYGEDGLEVGKSKFLQEKQLPFLIDNVDAILNNSFHTVKFASDIRGIKRYRKKIKKWCKTHDKRTYISPFTIFSRSNFENLNLSSEINHKSGRSNRAETICNHWRNLTEEERLM